MTSTPSVPFSPCYLDRPGLIPEQVDAAFRGEVDSIAAP